MQVFYLYNLFQRRNSIKHLNVQRFQTLKGIFLLISRSRLCLLLRLNVWIVCYRVIWRCHVSLILTIFCFTPFFFWRKRLTITSLLFCLRFFSKRCKSINVENCIWVHLKITEKYLKNNCIVLNAIRFFTLPILFNSPLK